jgi:hypothetical protein
MLNKGNYFIKTFDVAICTTRVWVCRGSKQKQVANRSVDYLFLVEFISAVIYQASFSSLAMFSSMLESGTSKLVSLPEK